MWDTNLYDKYGRERIQPSVDLANRLSGRTFGRILDAGCGTGMSTSVLLSVFPDAGITGVDLSEEMLGKARKNISQAMFIQRDCSLPLTDLGEFDLIFSNAFIQWLADQETFFENAFSMLSDGGVFAAQIPLFGEMPANACILEAEEQMGNRLDGVEKDKFVLHPAGVYYDMLCAQTEKTTVWITEYWHEMNGHEDILEFLKGAALTPHMDRLKEKADREEFFGVIVKNLKKAYPVMRNGKVIFPFRRMFLIGEKQG